MPTTPLGLLRNLALGALAIVLCASRPALADDALSLVLDAKTPTLMNTLNLVAQGAGFYKDERLSVTTALVDGSRVALETCAAGAYDICPIGIEPLILRYPEGIRLKMFLSRAARFTYVFAVLEDSPIKSLADFKGKPIGVHASEGTSSVAATESALAKAGLTTTDHILVTVGKEDSAINALVSGKVAGLALPYYELIPYIVAGRKLRIFHHPALDAVTNSGYAASPGVLAAKGDAVERFSRAIIKAALLVRYSPRAGARALLTARGEPFTDADLTRKASELAAWEDYLPASDPTSRRIGAITEPGIQAYIDILKGAGVIKAAIPASDVVTDDLIARANDFNHRSIETLANAQ